MKYLQVENENIKESFLRLYIHTKNRNYRGYEFDDLLSSSVIRLLTFNNLLLQRIAIQIGELCPLNIRPFLGVKRLESTKARGFFTRGYLYYYLLNQDPKWLKLAKESLEWLMMNYSHKFPGISWGNNFDYASGMGFFPKELPTVVWTSHIASTFELAYLSTKQEHYLNVLKRSADFITSALERQKNENGICFAYAPGIRALVHNSNLLGASTLLKCWKYFQKPLYYKLSKASYDWTISHINPDGSWYYGTGKKYRYRNWIDNFHTSYIIDCLVVGYEIGGEDIVPYSVIKKAYDFWIQKFFLEDGTPKYYHNKTHPLDIQCAAQAIELLSKLSIKNFPEALKIAEKVLHWTIEKMQKSNGAFRYQIRRLWKNNLESIHWGQSTMFAAIGAFLFYSSDCQSKYNFPHL